MTLNVKKIKVKEINKNFEKSLNQYDSYNKTELLKI